MFSRCYSLLAALVIATGIPADVQGARTIVNCQTPDSKIVASDQSNTTVSPEFIPVEDLTGSIQQGATGCVSVEVYAFFYAPGDRALMLDARLDNDAAVPYMGYNVPLLATADGIFGSVRTAKFIFPNVPAGNHSVRIFWRSSTAETVSLYEPILIIYYKK